MANRPLLIHDINEILYEFIKINGTNKLIIRARALYSTFVKYYALRYQVDDKFQVSYEQFLAIIRKENLTIKYKRRFKRAKYLRFRMPANEK